MSLCGRLKALVEWGGRESALAPTKEVSFLEGARILPKPKPSLCSSTSVAGGGWLNGEGMETAKRRAGEVCFQEEARILPAADAIVRRWPPEAGHKRLTSYLAKLHISSLWHSRTVTSAAGRADSASWPAPREARSQNFVVNHPSRLMIVSKLTDLSAIVNICLTS